MRCIIVLFVLGLSFTNVVGEHVLIFHHVKKRGHQVTFLSPFYPKEPNPNITEIVPQKLSKYIDENFDKDFDINLRVQKKMHPIKEKAYGLGYGACEALYKSPEFRNWLKKTKKVDLVIIDNCMSECGTGVAYKLGAKYIVFNTVTVLPYEYDMLGLMPETSAIPELEVYSPKAPMSFLSRVSNEVNTLRWRWSHVQYSKKIDTFIRKSLKVPNMPFIGDLASNVNLIFYTGDPVTDYPRSLPPLFVNVAGIHCKSPCHLSLSSELESFLSSNSSLSGHPEDGFIYISLGSLVVSSNLPQNIKNRFFDTIRAFPNLKFLWKWNGEFPKDIPSNLFLARWFPQLDLLAHPQIRGFITQSGRPSEMEALWNGVPMLSFPILGDQDFNSNRFTQMGGSRQLEIGSFTTEKLIAAVNELVYEPRMRLQMQKLQKIFRDRPMAPVDTAVWWTEYVLRTEDTSHLKPPGSFQFWFQRRQIDVWLFLLAVSLVITNALAFSSVIVVRFVWRGISGALKLKEA